MATKPSSSVSRSTPDQNLPTWLSIADIQAFLAIPRSSAYELARKLPSKKFGRHIRIHKSDIGKGGAE